MKFWFIIILGVSSQVLAQTPAPTPAPPTTPPPQSIYDSATKVQSANQGAQQNAQVISTLLNTSGMALVSSCCGSGGCGGGCHAGWVMIGMGALAQMQSNEHGNVAGGSGLTAGDTNGYNATPDSGSYNNGHTVSTDYGKTGFGAVAGKLSKISANGYTGTVENGKLVLPDGTKVSASDLSSPEAMSSAGLPKDAIAIISSELAKAQKLAAEKSKMTIPNFGTEDGAGGSATGLKAASPNAAAGLAGSGQAALASMNAHADVAGLSKDYHGEPIGIANDSIFTMMTRRYQLKERQDNFILRSPAAIKK